MQILALDMGKYKTVACDYEAETARHNFATVPTTAQALHDLTVEREPDRVVIEICTICWVAPWNKGSNANISSSRSVMRGAEQ